MKKLNSMQKPLFGVWGILLLLLASSCFKEKDVLQGTPTKNMSVSILKQMDNGEEILLTKDNVGVAPLSGTVISDAEAGNIEKGKFVIVQNKEDRAAGITISLAGDEEVPFVPGDSLVFDILGSTLKRVDGRLEVTNVSPAKITKVATGKIVAPLKVSLDELAKNFDAYESMLVFVAGIDIISNVGEPNTYTGTKPMYDSSNEPGTVNLNTLSTAGFAEEEVPVNANFTGIAVPAQGSLNIRMRTLDDVSVTSSPLDPSTDLIITGFMADPRGADSPPIGGSTGAGVITLGNGEYVQLMALRDIDFEDTPYSVVLMNSAATLRPTANGWAHGGTYTFKFDITEGSIRAGEFGYVGGPAKKISGYWSGCLYSNDISHANWLRSIATPSVGGDGFGAANFSLGNAASGDGRSRPACGIAVFKGTTVTSTTVPIDAMFYGTSIDDVYDAANNRGYTVPLNDHYNPVHPETGDAQPFFGQGTNTYLVPTPGYDLADFPKLGGVVSRNAWIVPRQPTMVRLYSADCAVASTFTLETIETGNGVTFFRK